MTARNGRPLCDLYPCLPPAAEPCPRGGHGPPARWHRPEDLPVHLTLLVQAGLELWAAAEAVCGTQDAPLALQKAATERGREARGRGRVMEGGVADGDLLAGPNVTQRHEHLDP